MSEENTRLRHAYDDYAITAISRRHASALMLLATMIDAVTEVMVTPRHTHTAGMCGSAAEGRRGGAQAQDAQRAAQQAAAARSVARAA